MLVEMLTRVRAILPPALLAVALCAAILPLSPASAQMTTSMPMGSDMPPIRGDMPPMGGNFPPMGGDIPGMPGNSGGPGDEGPDNAGPGGDWMSNPMLMPPNGDRRLRRPERAAPYVSTIDDGEQYIPDEVMLTVARSTSPEQIKALLERNQIYLIEQIDSEVGNAIFIRARILDQRPVIATAATIAGESGVILATPNSVYRLQRAPAEAAAAASPPLQYALARLHLPQAHGVARGDAVLVGMIDSAVDPGHPDLEGTIAAVFDATGGGAGSHPHGTAVASLIAGHGRLTGSAPAARLLVARAFDNRNAKGNSFTVLKSIDWLAGRGARIINMSFAGPADPAVRRMINGAYARSIVLIAAAGNAGPSSPPLYPAAEPRVIAVTATDAGDRLYSAANRGSYIAVAAPGVDLFVAAPDGGYGILSGTSFSAAEVSGIAALMIQRRPKLTPDQLRAQLLASARPVGAGVRLADAYGAVTAGQPAGARPKPRGR
jgi:subtilisin family serine protease